MKDKKIMKVALDIGNHSIKLLMGEMNSECTKISVLDYVKVRSRGIRKSIIEDSEAFYESLSEAVQELTNKIGYAIDKMSVGIGSSGVISRTKNIGISFEEKEIKKEDLDKLYQKAKKEIFGAKVDGYYRTLYCEAYNIKINNAKIVRDPVGMIAKELQATVYVVYIDEAYVEKIVEIINKLGLEVDNIYLNSYVSAKGTLDIESRKMGIAHVDIGYASTDIILLKNNKVLHTKTIQIGEMHYISDLSYMLKISKEMAQEILEKFKNKEYESDNTIKFDSKKVSIRDIKDVIQARTGDIIDFINLTIEDSGFNGYLAKGIVLTGGVADLEGVLENIKGKIGYPVKKELPIKIKGLNKYSYGDAVVVGIFFEDLEKEYRSYQEKLREQENVNTEENDEEMEEKIDEVDEILEEELEEEGESFFNKAVSKTTKFFKEFF